MSEEQLKDSSANDLADAILYQERSSEELTDEQMVNIIGGSNSNSIEFSSDEFGTNYRYIITNLDGARRG
jgi:hypothetical protein